MNRERSVPRVPLRRLPARLWQRPRELWGDLRGEGLEAWRRHRVPAERAAGPDRLQVTWMGTAGLYVRDGSAGFFVDPFVTRPGLVRVLSGRPLTVREPLVRGQVRRLGAHHARAVFVSHSHYDHVMDAPAFCHHTGAVLYGSQSTLNVGRGAGLPERQCRLVTPREPIAVGRFRVTFLESRHGTAFRGRIPYPGEIDAPLVPPAPARQYRLGGTYAVWVEHPEGSFLHLGSAGWRARTFDGVRADVVLLCLAGRDDTEALLANVVDAVGARRVIPIHLDHFFFHLYGPMVPLVGVALRSFFDAAAAHTPPVAVQTLPLGEPRPLFGGAATPRYTRR